MEKSLRPIDKALALAGILALTAWLGSSRAAYAFPYCGQIEGTQCETFGAQTLCETYSTPASKICTCEGDWVCEPMILIHP